MTLHDDQPDTAQGSQAESTMDDVQRRAALYHAVGGAIHLAQSLELFLSAVLSIARDRFDAPIDVDGLLLPDYGQTLGQLIREMKKVGQIDATGEHLLANALDSRNYVAHHFFNRNAFAFSADDAFHAALQEVERHSFVLAAGTTLLLGWLEACCAALGIDRGAILVRQRGGSESDVTPAMSLDALASRRMSSR